MGLIRIVKKCRISLDHFLWRSSMNNYDDTRPQLKLVGGTDFEKDKLGIPRKHRGVLFARILEGQHPQENTRLLEEGFVNEWSEENQRDLLEMILCTEKDDPQRKFVPKTRREWEVAHLVAASIIQWLPTSVGCSFLGRAFKRGGGDFSYRLPDYEKKSHW